MPARARGLKLQAGAAALVAALTPGLAIAQVLEVGEGGAVTVYDGPAVFTAQGASPIAQGRSGRPSESHPPPVRTPPRAAIAAAADKAALSPALVGAVAWRESDFRPGLTSRAGAIGEMQLRPDTARDLGVNPHDTAQNYEGGAAYLRRLMTRYDGNLTLALAAYNAGPGAVDRYGGVPPFKETQAYVAAILDRLSGEALAANPAPEGTNR
jgi:soluble lytic murein transglycosylase-like protein